MELKKGINLGGWLSQCVHTQEHYSTFILPEDIDRIAEMGFDHIRVPVDAEAIETADGDIIESGCGYITMAVERCRERGLNMIIDLHKAYGYDFNDANDAERNNLFAVPELQERFLALWKKIAGRFGGYDNVAFELLNEVVERENNEAWNSLIDRCVAIIRAVAPDAPIIYGGIQWNSTRTLKLLRKPVSHNIIYTFHFYEPLMFTHQQARWVPALDGGKNYNYPGSMDYYRQESKALGYQGNAVLEAKAETMGPEFIKEMIEEAVTAAKNAGVPLYCGEYGVIDRAPVEDTLRWFEDVDSVFRELGIGWALWSYKKMDFGLIDGHYDPIRAKMLEIWNK